MLSRSEGGILWEGNSSSRQITNPSSIYWSKYSILKPNILDSSLSCIATNLWWNTKGRENVATDSMSRRNEADDDSAFLMITAVESDWIDQVIAMVHVDSYFQELKTKWETGTLEPSVYRREMA